MAFEFPPSWLSSAFWNGILAVIATPVAAYLGSRHYRQELKIAQESLELRRDKEEREERKHEQETEAMLAAVTDKATAELIRRLSDELKECKTQHEQGSQERRKFAELIDRQSIVISAMKINMDALLDAVRASGIKVPPLLVIPELGNR